MSQPKPLSEEQIIEALWDYANSLPPCPECGGWGGSHSVVNGDLCSRLSVGKPK